MTELRLENGDYVPNGLGGVVRTEGAEAVLEQVRFRLTARRGTFPFWPDLGSRLWQLGRISAANRQSAAEQYVAEALEEETGLFGSITDEEIEAACKKASVHDFIMTLPRGYDTPVGELGDTLSSGERQRLGLARAFLHDAPFLLLDEPTSNLDSLNEAVILRSLGEERRDKTVILVSHRKSTMRIVDQLYSVEQGRVS